MGEAARKVADDEASLWARQEALREKRKSEWHAYMTERFGEGWRERTEEEHYDLIVARGLPPTCAQRYAYFASRMAKKVAEWERQEQKQKDFEAKMDRCFGEGWKERAEEKRRELVGMKSTFKRRI
jgi:hypothetical protein